MSFFRDLFDGRVRRARAAEAEGRHRDAAALYAAMGERVDAGRCLAHAGDKATDHEERIAAWLDALSFYPDIALDERKAVEIKIGRAILEEARVRGVASPEERRRVADAAERLERSNKYAEAADAFELLGQKSDAARCLELGGEVDRLETLLAETNAVDAKEARIRRLVSEHELALALGDRRAARASLREVVSLAPEDAGMRQMLRRLEERWLVAPITLLVGGKRVAFSRALPAVIGRSDAEVVVRGTSVSRRHAEIAQESGRFVVRDLGSRNGTLVSGMPLAGALPIEGTLELGLGDDVSITVRPAGEGIELEVQKGLDRGLLHVLGASASDGVCVLAVPGASATIELDREGAVITPLGESAELIPEGATSGRRVQGRIDLLRGDVLVIGEVRVEVAP
ncbi:MAG: FHA domain-containing protein [Deltaproteobacteria bacterium]|nr:FHA domain-containing protein [Deltaproteobacteria bacterium]